MPPVTSDVKAKKKSAFSCQSCRYRKVKCGGEQPECKRCISRRQDCHYRLSPTLTYTQRLEARVEELESMFARAGTTPPNGLALTRPANHASHKEAIEPSELLAPTTESEVDNPRLNAKGFVNYPNSTSLFESHVGADETFSLLPATVEAPSKRRERLVQNAWQQKSQEVLAETPEPFQYLLTNHWCWIQPLFNFIYRPAFTRDMQTLGPYYSHTLLNAVLAHATRWCRDEPEIRSLLQPYDNGTLFSRHARTLLFEEIREGRCNIPTVQTLLLLSAQECGAGNRTQAWLYSGIAFRLIEDLGICVDNQVYPPTVHFTDEDIEIRSRLFWSCYFWDKIISLYLGRIPVLQDSPVSPPQILLDDSAEDEIWRPHGLHYLPGSKYPDTKARSTSCFTQMCRLSVILNQILLYMYNPQQEKSHAEIQTCVDLQGRALASWWEALPEHLKIHTNDLPSHAPPSHIVTLNCLFHTFTILLHRPMLFNSNASQGASVSEPEHLRECMTSANSILLISDLFRRTFGDSRVVLSLAYSVYTAASIFLLKIQATVPADELSLQKMAYCVGVLDCVKSSTPVIQDALRVISQSLDKHGIDMDSLSAMRWSETKAMPDSSEQWRAPASMIASDSRTIPSSTEFSFFSDVVYSDVHVDSDMVEVFSRLEPISVSVGALDNSWS